MKTLKVSLVALNPWGCHNTSLYLLKTYALKDAYIKENVDFSLHFFDSLIPHQSNGVDFIIRRIIEDDSSLIGFSCYCWNIKEVLEIADIIKKIDPQKKIVLGGPEASGNASYLMEQYNSIDMIIKGEGELAFSELLGYYLEKIKDIKAVSSLVFRDGERISYNMEAKVEDLGDIPQLFSTGNVNANEIGESLYSFETKRGCTYQCDYCFHHKGSHLVREYPLKQVKEELNELLNSNLKYIWVTDPCFNENEERSIEIIQYIVQNNHKQISFAFELRNETLTERFIIELSKLESTRFIAMGLQTITDRALDAIHRKFDRDKFEHNLTLIKKYFRPDVRIHIDLIYGLPLDTLLGYKHSIDYCISLGGIIFTQPLKVLPGTRLEGSALKYGIVTNPNPPYEVLYHNSFSFKDMCQAKKINTALYLYQSHSTIEQWFRQIQAHKGERLSDIFEELGSCLWDKKIDPLFLNYKQFSVGFLLKASKGAYGRVYNIAFDISQGIDETQIIQVDWGSIANQQFYR